MMSTFEEGLIEMVRSYPNLYDSQHRQYYDVPARNNAWEEISTVMGRNAEECRKRWATLRDSFKRSQVRKVKCSGQKVTPWKYEEEMSFLKDVFSNRSQKSILTNEVEEEGEVVQCSVDPLITPSYEECPSPERLTNQSPSPSSPAPSMDGEKKKSKSLTTALVLQNYLKDKEQRRNRRERANDPLILFFMSMAEATRRLPIDLQNDIKMRLLTLVCENEAKAQRR